MKPGSSCYPKRNYFLVGIFRDTIAIAIEDTIRLAATFGVRSLWTRTELYILLDFVIDFKKRSEVLGL